MPESHNLPLDSSDFIEFPVFNALDDEDLSQWLNHANIRPVSAIRWNCLNGWEMNTVSKEDHYFCRVIEGDIDIHIPDKNRKLRVRDDEVFLIPQGEIFSVKSRQQSPVYLDIIHFYATTYDSIDLIRLLGFPYHLSRNTLFFERTFTNSVREFAFKKPGWEKSLVSNLWNLILYGIREHPQGFDPEFGPHIVEKLPRLAKVLSHIENNLQEKDFKISDLSKIMRVSEVTLRKIFHQHLGTSPALWIQKRRIEMACYLLKRETDTLETIAERCGFNGMPFFYRSFKKWIGQTPNAYRRDLSI